MRVALDTNVIRCFVQSPEVDGAFFHRLGARKPSARYSLTTVAVLELALQLFEQRIPWHEWVTARREIALLLDPSQPTIDGKGEIQLVRQHARQAAYKSRFRTVPPSAFWQRMLGAASVQDLASPFVSTDSLGAEMETRMDAGHLRVLLDDRRAGWLSFVEDMRAQFSSMDGTLRSHSFANLTATERSEISRSIFSAAYTSGSMSAKKVDAYLEATIHFMRLSENATPYNPAKHPSDDLDLQLLMVLAEADILLTLDGRLIRHVHATPSSQKRNIMTPHEYLAT